MAPETSRKPDSEDEGLLYARPECLLPVSSHYCAGCGHSTVHRILAELIDEMNLRERIIGIAPVGCAVLAYNYIDIDWSEAAHGRPPAVATGIKRVHPDKIVFTYQGDGDLAAIGAAETIHCANRGEPISTVFINNAIYGMTQGQMAPTTLIGQKTKTTPYGRDVRTEGAPIRVCELLSSLDGAVFLARTTVTTPKQVRETKRLIRRSIEIQEARLGYSLIEVLSPCPTFWGMSPVAAMKFIEETLTVTFPLGIIKDTTAEREAAQKTA
jgi:2-oxoglutarate ferredoxin oxidoreductase subunit beta